MSIKDIATQDVVTASSDTPVSDLVSKMDSNDVGTVVITDGSDPTGIVSDRATSRDTETELWFRN